MSLWRRAKPATSSIILEVSPRAAKVMVASASPSAIQRINASTLPADTEDALAALRALLSAQSIGGGAVGLLIGREAVSVRTLELPSTDPKELASMLDLQLGKLTPYPRADILSAWTAIGSLREGYTTVLLAIARKALIQELLQACKMKGIAPQWVGVSTEGLEAWWAMQQRRQPRAALPSDQVAVVIDVDSASTDCAVLSADGRLLFTHSIPIGYQQLTAAEASQVRWVGELVRLPRILLHEEIKGRIGCGLITGAAPSMANLVEQLSSQWGVAVEVVDALEFCAPSASVRQSAAATHVSYAALAGVVAAGRPLRLDLLPAEVRVSAALRLRAKHLTRLSVSLAVIVGLFALLYLERIVILQRYLGRLRQQLAAVHATSAQVLERQAAMRTIQQWLAPNRSALEVLQGIASAADAEITVTQLTMAEEKPVTIRGRATTMASAFAFADRLKQRGLFDGVDVRPVLRPKGASDLGAEFELVCNFPVLR